MKKLSLVTALSALFISGCSISVGAQPNLKHTQESLVLNNAKALSGFNIHAGSGSLTVVGEEGLTAIHVDAAITTSEDNEYKLTLANHNGSARLVAKTDNSQWSQSHNSIDLTVRMPKGMMLDINDGSGKITVSDLNNNLKINDGSGHIDLTNINGAVNINDGSGGIKLDHSNGSVDINDGSGSIDLHEIGGAVTINDGSGQIEINHVTGNVGINDGSGSVLVNDISGNVRVDDGSGDIDVSKVKGNVTISDGSGDIDVSDANSLIIRNDGSGGISSRNIKGTVKIPSK
ncbi:hypothetical protein [Psychrobium sp. 1_MG-2023]|uniref:hypothetical protein n=1 Tax=Psychrobium sp. 1_MG-2023 TaxID=3062624 RepID=UPI000C338ECA|nr:hypothetical protein [Psychrobium sp. 1_MG-2023]MDP2560836.1 hypothetical protein [Psychrobium sp. 1_MG-2023]PKF56710.1 hypothetical protein CW748_09535 [Alteromonadales bacterium alter-6D02]